jgi:hypothetical protein
MVKIILTNEMRKKDTLHHPFSIFGREISIPISLHQFPTDPEIHAHVQTLTLSQAKLVPHQSRSASKAFSFDYNLELSEETYFSYKELGLVARPILFSFVVGDKEIATLAPMGEVGLHAKKLYVISFTDEEKKLASLLNKPKFSVHVAALSLTP